MSEFKSTLNIAAGKMKPIKWLNDVIHHPVLVNLDQMFLDTITIEELEKKYKNNLFWEGGETVYVNFDVYEFLERTICTFDSVAMYRFLEHVPKTKILYFLYILSTVLKIGGLVDVIVPDYEILAKRILEEDVKSPNFEAHDIITTFELLNEPYCPHASIWTIDRLNHFFELEGRFKTLDHEKNYDFDGRNIYIRYLAERIK